MQWAIAAALICSSTVFTSCTKQDNPTTPDLNLSEKIIGKWLTDESTGHLTLTNYKRVYTFASATKAYISASHNTTEGDIRWDKQMEADVAIDGNKVTLIMHPNEGETMMEEYVVTAINGNEFTANHKTTVTAGSDVVFSVEDVVRYVKQPADYSAAIVGTWQGRCTSEGSVFDDGQEHRWEYKADGTFVYYVKDGDSWVPSDNSLNEYFVDGTLLCTRWIDNEVENREWWEITIDGDKMNWTALRQNPDGTTFTATFEMTKVVE